MERDSSDEEEDRQTLIHQNDTKHHHHHPLPTNNSPRTSTFHIQDQHEAAAAAGGGSNLRLFRFNLHYKRYLFAIFLPLFILILYFTTDIRNLLSSTNFNISRLPFPNSLSDRMKESELRALYLLSQQQLSLLTLWNHTSLLNHSSSSSSSSFTLFEDVKSGILHQISLNKEIQQVLLSTHKTPPNISSLDNQNDPTTFVAYGYDSCRKADHISSHSQRRTIDWNPNNHKFLFAICLSGQMSNHLICLQKHMFFAALLNRVLVIPSSKVDFQ